MNPHLAKSGSPVALARSLATHGKLIQQLAKRDVSGRYRGSIAGFGWSFFTPLLMLAVYTFVFSVVFQARWGVETGGREAFAIILFVGIIVHGLFAECVNRAPTLILAHGNYVKRVVFPLEILPLVTLVSALFHTAVSLAVLLVAQLLINGSLPWTALLFPLVLAPLVLTTIGFTWLLAGLGVYVRDISQVTAILTMVMLFLAPVFYPVSALPEPYQRWLYLNPLTFIIEQARVVLLWGDQPDWIGLGKHFAMGALVAWAGFWSFQKLRRGFADVI